jgi:hypothetical protein
MVFRLSGILKAERAVFHPCKSVAAILDNAAAIVIPYNLLTLTKSRLIKWVLPVLLREFKNTVKPH